jgi:CDP-glucose 4,6-dehydratase
MVIGFNEGYAGKRVFITGNTGFKGSWLSQWLILLGAEVYGYALEPPTNPSLFKILGLKDKIYNQIDDVLDFEILKKSIREANPDIIFHLAAQSLVPESYKEPLLTVQVNTLGTVNLLEAVRQLALPTAIIAVTTDKCYENKEWLYGYRETDPMGGYDPYSASKAAAEILISSWRNSFFNPVRLDEHGVRLASVRSGNVIGGGDWNIDHIITDSIYALINEKSIGVRNPQATRPWLHVLESLGGYLTLGEKLMDTDNMNLREYCEPFNFGPLIDSNKTVEELVEAIIMHWGHGSWHSESVGTAYHESSLLQLSIEKAHHKLHWLPQWDFGETVQNTIEWYKQYENDADMVSVTTDQIISYQSQLNNIITKKTKVPETI